MTHQMTASLSRMAAADAPVYEMKPNAGPKVDAFVRRHPQVSQLLPSLAKALSETFGPDAKLLLNVWTSHETPSTEQLVVSVSTHEDIYAALDKLSAFDDEWWRDKDVEIDDLLSVEVDTN